MIEENEWFCSITITTWSGGTIPKMLVCGTVKDTLVVWVTPPPGAGTVTFDVPVSAVLLTVNVSVELPLPGAASGLGLKPAGTPRGEPRAGSAGGEIRAPPTCGEQV